MDDSTRQCVKDHIASVLERLIEKKTVTEPFVEDDIKKNNPFGFRLVPIEVWKGAKFERSFVTTLGQGIFEQIGKIIAQGTGAYAENQHDEELTINTFRTETIDTTITNQRSSRKKGNEGKPDLSKEIDDLLNLKNDKYETILVRSDLYICRQNGKKEYYSFKTVKPNLDQTAEAKRNLLVLRVSDIECESFFALPYNPAGEGNPYYKAKHSIPRKLFDMEDSNYVLIGADLWNKIGQDENTYDELVEIFDEVGAIYSEKIRKEYFNIK